MRMKAKILVVVAVLVITSVGALASDCTTASLATYIATGFSCTIDGKTFSGFTYTPTPTGGATAPAATDITVTPVLSGSNEGFIFNGNLGIFPEASGQSLDLAINFDAAVTNGAALIEDASFFTLSAVAITGTGALSITEGLCQPGPIPSCNSFSTGLSASASTPGTFFLGDQTIFTPTGSIEASKDIFSTTGTLGSVQITGIEDLISQIPEPASLFLLGGGLLALGGALRRRLRSS